MTDQQSFDAISCVAGSRWFHTPHLDALAEGGTRFDRAYCANPLCVPSRTSMFSGHYPWETGVRANQRHDEGRPVFPGFGKPFIAAGYDTGHVGKWHMEYEEDDFETHGFRWVGNRLHNGADPKNNPAAFEFLDQVRDPSKPFLLCVSYNNPHNICEWARGARGDLPDGSIPEPPPLHELPPPRPNKNPPEDEPEIAARLRRAYHATGMSPVGDFGEKEWREYQWAYYRMAEHIDRHVGDLIAGLEARGLRKNTLVVFTSDHGDAQGAHRWNQKTVLIEESARVPLIINWPGRVPSNRVLPRLINTGVDLLPTFCEAAGIAIPPELPGTSFWSAATASQKNTPDPEFIISCARFIQGAEIDGEKPEAEARMIRSDRYKYIAFDRGDFREMLFDLQNDPHETRNLARDPAATGILAERRRRLRQFCVQHADPFLPHLPTPWEEL